MKFDITSATKLSRHIKKRRFIGAQQIFECTLSVWFGVVHLLNMLRGRMLTHSLEEHVFKTRHLRLLISLIPAALSLSKDEAKRVHSGPKDLEELKTWLRMLKDHQRKALFSMLDVFGSKCGQMLVSGKESGAVNHMHEYPTIRVKCLRALSSSPFPLSRSAHHALLIVSSLYWFDTERAWSPSVT